MYIKDHSGMTVNELADWVWNWNENVGWHNKTELEQLALICSEIGEAANECRGSKPTQEFGAELADIILRTLDLARNSQIDINFECWKKMKINMDRGTRGREK